MKQALPIPNHRNANVVGAKISYKLVCFDTLVNGLMGWMQA